MKALYLHILILLFSLTMGNCAVSSDEPIIFVVGNEEELTQTLIKAEPNSKILIKPGNYRGGFHFIDIKGLPDKPIIIGATDKDNPPVIIGGGNCIQFSDCEYLELHDIILEGATGNGLNIDDGGTFDTPSHHIVLKNLIVRDVGPEGNRDGIKLSGVDDFLVQDCIIERWGSGGSGIDMVGCHNGIIEGCTFRHGDDVGGNAIQTKGGSENIIIRRCRFEHAGMRAINAGGSTGLQFFRPKPQGYEAKNIIIEGCTFIGSVASIAFVGIDGAIARYNTIYRPTKWVLRILQETQAPDFVPSRNGQFINNIVAFRSDEVNTAVNVGIATAPETFKFSHNLWYCLDRPENSKLQLPVEETDGIYGVDPIFKDAENGDLSLKSESPASDLGADAFKE